ncbi:MAG: smalltalk protein [Prevotella sp.]|nr:smalltalk protein [Prevotella sp.]
MINNKWSVIINAILTAVTSIISALTVSSCAL